MMSESAFLVLLLLLVTPTPTLAAMTAQGDDTSWLEFGGNRRHTGESSVAGPRHACTVLSWTRVPVTSDTNPIVDGEQTVYFGQWGQETSFYAWSTNASAPSSRQLWNDSHAELGVVAGSTPLLDEDSGRLFVITDSLGKGFFCLDAHTGKQVWPHYLPTADSTCAPTFSRDKQLVYVGDWMANFYAVRAGTGELAWNFTDLTPPTAMPFNFNAAPVVHPNGTLVYAASLHKLYAFDSATGAIRWNLCTNRWTNMTMPSLALIFDEANNALVFSALSNYLTVRDTPLGLRKLWNQALYSIDASTGAVRWQALAKPESASKAAIALCTHLDIVLYGSDSLQESSEHWLVAVAATDGTPRWRVPLAAPITSIVIDAVDTVYVTYGSVLSAFDAASGGKLWTWTHSTVFVNMLAITSSGTLWLSDDNEQFGVGADGTPCVDHQ